MTDFRQVLWTFLWALALVYGAYNLTRSFLGPKQGEDFAQYYVASHLLLDGEEATLYDKGSLYQEKAKSYGVKGIGPSDTNSSVMTYAYPPFVAFFLLPFAKIPYEMSRCLFFLMSVLFSFGSIPLFFSHRACEQRRDMTKFALMAALLFFPNYYSFYMGQINSFVFFCCVLALFLIRKGNPFMAGFCVALASSIKIFPLILLLFFLVKKQYRAVLGIFLGLVLLTGLSLMRCDFHLYVTFFTQVLPEQFSGGAWIRNQGFVGFFSRLLTSNEYVRSLGNYPGLAHGLSIFFSLCVLISSLICTWKNKNSYELQYAIYFVTALLVLAKSWEHYGMFLLFSYFYLFEDLIYRRFSKRRLFLICVSFCIWAFIQTTGLECYELPQNLLMTLLISSKLMATLVLWFCHCMTLREAEKNVPAIGSK